MGKKGSWFSAIKRVFTHGSKDKQPPPDGSDKKRSKEKRTTKSKSFIPLFREPSSIEKILGEADQLLIKAPAATSEQPKTSLGRPISSPRVTSPRRAGSPKTTSPRPRSPKASRPVISPKVGSPKVASPKAVSPRVASPKVASPRILSPKASTSKAPPPPKTTKGKKGNIYVKRPEPTLKDQQVSAVKIQAAFRGYLARRSFRAVKGLVRLQGVVKGQNVKRQTMNAMRQMQLLVRVQTQIQSRRIQMFENQRRNDKEAESTISKWTLNQLSEAGQNGDWDDSVLTKEEVDERLRKKVEAVIKRERAMAYAYSHQLWKENPNSSHTPVDIRANGYPWWWNWLDRQLPQLEGLSRAPSVTKNTPATPSRSISGIKPSPRSHQMYGNLTPNNQEPGTPQSSRSAIPSRAKQFHTPGRTPPANNSPFGRYPKLRPNSNYNTPLKDDDSLVSCPPFSAAPSYMAPTVSAKAKVRPNSNPKERFPGTPGNDSKRRFSFPLTPNAGTFKWNKGMNKDTASQAGAMDKRSVGDMSVDSTVSMPAGLTGRKPFNRFV